MRWLRALFTRLSGFVMRSRGDDFDAELESHLQLHIDDNLRAGMTPDDARRLAILKLGGIESTRQAYRDRSSVPFLEHLIQDLRFALRHLTKAPGFALTAILTMTLGFGSAVGIYAFVDAALVQPLPYSDPWRLVDVTERQRAGAARKSVLSGLSRLEAAAHGVPRLRFPRRPTLCAHHAGGAPARAGRSRQRRILPNPRRSANPGPRLLRRRGPAGSRPDGHHQRSGLAHAIRRPLRHRRSHGHARRRAVYRSSAYFPPRFISRRAGRSSSGRRFTLRKAAIPHAAATRCWALPD